MSLLATVNERSTSYLTITFKDKDGNLAAPSSATYQINCMTTGTEIKADTALGGGSSVEVTISAAENALIDQTNRLERRRVTVDASFAGGQEHHEEFDYYVKNLAFVS